ncbi:hypothetical protein F4820DRAFT_466422 [Hypoxylon rubiginosum]|uniref:Uncharacterized protein n=1 Tax=Hypoxylon rubiginosum TaxID=110542 RepID=A0ACB9YK08_9PEZI|nr:hypothetical protein F4820DRAFT_466422 [Hypoxylon rubiginosum]
MALYLKNVTLVGVLSATLNTSIAPLLAMDLRLSYAQIVTTVPSQPLPLGRITFEQATTIIHCMYPTTLIIAISFGGLVPCLLEMNFLHGLGTPYFLARSLEVATGRFMLVSAIAATSHIQDFRDVEVDRATRRKTILLIIRDINARILAVPEVGEFTIVSCWFWEALWRKCVVASMAALMLVMKLLLNPSEKGDDLAWKNLWFLGMLKLFSQPLFTMHRHVL